MENLAVILERISELVASKMSVSSAIAQVAKEIRAFEKYCEEGRKKIKPGKFTTEHLRTCKYK